MEVTIQQLLQQGVAAHNEGNLQEAERLYRAILHSQPKHPDANHNLGLIAISVNQSAVALPLFKTALEANPKIEQFWLSYLDALVKGKELMLAKKLVKKAKKNGINAKKLEDILSQSAPAMKIKGPPQEEINILFSHYQSGRINDAEKLATSIIQKYPMHQPS